MDDDDLNGDEEEERVVKALLRDAFGEPSSSSSPAEDDEDFRSTGEGGFVPNWKKIREIDGLWICRDFLSPDQQSSLLSSIHEEGWLSDASCNQAMRFGDLPSWAVELSNSIREAVIFSRCPSETAGLEMSPFPSELLWREPLFDQLIMNTYEPGEGICAHVDLMRFEDGIAIVSLESSCIMHFSRADHEEFNSDSCEKIPVYLTEGSVVVMSGEARYNWKHEINRKPGFQVWEGREIEQKKRTSITLRKLCPTPAS